MNSRFFRSIFFAIAVTAFCGNFYQIDAQTGVDPTYIGVPSVSVHPPDNVPSVFRQAIQADGKILIWGGALAVEGIAKGRLARLNADGTLDNSFTYCHCGIDGLNNAAPLPDGKILVGGHAANISKVIRLNNDGSLDTTFNYVNPPNGFGSSSATIVAVQPDGRFFVNRFQAFQGFGESSVFHFNTDGSRDTAFTPIFISSGSPPSSALGAIKVLLDDRIYVAINSGGLGGSTSSTSLKRYTATGATDSTWETPSFGQPPSSGGHVLELDTQADGSVLAVGYFQTVNGTPRRSIVRLTSTGNVDLNFSTPQVFMGTGVKALTNGKILYSYIPALGDGGSKMVRLLSDGTQDNTYAMETGLAIRNPWVIDASEQVIFLGVGLTRLLVDGARDTSFNPNVGNYGRVHALARQADGKVIVAGEFIRFNGVPSISLARTNIDGTLDATYNAGTGFNGIPSKMLLQPDGKLLVIGSFSSYNGTAAPGIVRIMSDGTIDPLFSVTPTADSELLEIELQADGRIFIAGSFTTVNGTSRPGVARLNADGTLDNSFNALVGGSPRISAVVVQPDNKVLIGGTFTGIGGFNRSNFARVDSTGALDQSFNPADTKADKIYLASDGKIFTTHRFPLPIKVIRRNSDGSVDPAFASVSFEHTFSTDEELDSILVRSDGSVIVGGFFNQVGSSQRTGIVRLTPNGSVDPLFLPNSTDGRVRTVVDGGSGKVLIGGDFTRVENTTKAGLARLNVEPFRKTTPFDFNGDGRADFAVFRPSTNQWYRLMNSTWEVFESTFGLSGDIVAPGDFDGDGRTDLAIYRPSAGAWWYAASSLGGAHRSVSHGINGDIPRPSDFDGDGKTDYVVYRPSNGTWARMNSTGQTSNIAFGAAGDQPVIGDFDGDGKSDPAIFRPSTGDWWYAASSAGNQHRAVHWGQTGDLPAPADFDGDGKTDFAVYRPSNGGWYIVNSSNGSFVITGFGVAEDRPIPADYDGDGRADIAVFRPSTGVWYLMQSTSGIVGLQWGVSTDIAIPNSYVPQAP